MLQVLNPARDDRVEDPTNRWIIDPLARALVPGAIRLRISANAISVSGLFVGAASALAYWRWQQPGWAVMGFLVRVAWLVTDSLDGMGARATGTSTPFGRELDGLCDHAVFAMIYVALACSVGGIAIWSLAIAAGMAHAVQANLYETERNRFNRRLGGGAPGISNSPQRNPAIRLYNWIASRLECVSATFDRRLATAADRDEMRRRYDRAAVPVLRLMAPLNQNIRLLAVFLACALGRMPLFFWFDLVPLSILTAIGVGWHRQVETNLMKD